MNPAHLALVLAQQPAGGGGGGAGGCGAGSMQGIIMMLLMFAVFWFILIRPQQKRAKEHAALLSNLKKGDQVITRGGIIGRISGVADTVLTIEVQEKVRMRVLRSHVEGRYQDATAKASTDDVVKVEPTPTKS